MLNHKISGPDSAISEWLKRRSWPAIRLISCGLILLNLCATHKVQAQSAPSGIQAYADAIKQSTIAERVASMERYLSTSGGSLKTDALEFLVWDNQRLGHQSQSQKRAQDLLAVSPGNPIAVAVLNQDVPVGAQGKALVQNRLASLNSAMSGIDRMSKPEGMQDRNFQMLRQQVAIMLNGAVGMSYFALEDYPRARLSLEQAVASDPNNSQWVYGMGISLLNGKNRDPYRGYWYLARAANLTGGGQGQEIANYGRRVYLKDGGNDAGWERFQASAAALDAPPSLDSGGAKPPSNTVVASASRPASPTRSTAAASTPTEPTAGETASPRRKKKTTIGFEDTLHEPPSRESANAPAPAPNRPKGIAAPSEAVSLGILIETSLLTNQNRQAIIATLRDIVRNLRSNDEACILVFSDELDFEQDLTADDNLLEEAISQIHPKPGNALLPGIAFAAGHLKRIGKNSNRILLVISDGRSGQAAASDTLMFRSQVSGVRIDCIGLKADGADERALLERVASYSGGRASFASDSGQFRTAALEMTRTMGIAIQ